MSDAIEIHRKPVQKWKGKLSLGYYIILYFKI